MTTPERAVVVRAASWAPLGLALGATAVFVVWADHDGGFDPLQWLPGSLALLAMLAASLCSAEVRARLRTTPAALLLGLYALWSYASIAWAEVRGDALDGANRTLLYTCVFALFCSLVLDERGRTLVVAGWSISVAVIGVVGLHSAAAAAGPAGHFVLGRLATPATYSNANAALFLLAYAPLQVLASRREAHVAFRAAAGAVCAVLVDLALLSQSRGSLVALPIALLFYLVVARNSLRALVSLVVTAVAVGIAVPWLLDVYSAVVDGHGYAAALRNASLAVGVSALLAGVGSALVAVADSRVRVPARTCALIRHATIVVAAAAAVAALAALLLVGHPRARIENAWNNFTTDKKAKPASIHIVSGLGSGRYDIWRIAVKQFAAHPIGGVGADNYLRGYLRERRSTDVARYPLSMELRAFSETGLVGAILFFGFLVLALRSAFRAARSRPEPTVALACLVGFAYWAVHASVDWFWEFPALTGPALALLGLAAGAAPETGLSWRRRALEPRRPRPVTVAAAAILFAAAAFLLGALWVAARQTNEALAIGQVRPDRAYSLLRTASRLNPLSTAPAYAEATIAANVGERGRERRALHEALERGGPDPYAYLMLGIVAGSEDRLAAARANLARARKLSPFDGVIIFAQQRLKWGDPLTEREIAGVFRLTTRTLRGVDQRGG